jgi:hypothetical protein
MKLTGTFVAICCGVALFAACKKDNSNSNNNNNPSATAQTLEAGKWQLTAAVATLNYMGKDTSEDEYSKKDACEKDNFLIFASNGTVTVDEGANKCSGHSQTSTFPWALLDNDTRLALVDSNPDTVNLEITSTQMKLKLTAPNSSGDPVTYVETYKNIK